MSNPTLFKLTDSPSVANHYLAQLRDVEVQKDSFRFRKNLERLGEIMACEISKTLHFEASTIQTPLAAHQSNLIQD